MRWYNKLRLVFRIYSRRMFVTMLLFGMCFVSFFMIDRVFTGYIGSRYAIKQTEKERFIPAYAGNSNASQTFMVGFPVHPRLRGELGSER